MEVAGEECAACPTGAPGRRGVRWGWAHGWAYEGRDAAEYAVMLGRSVDRFRSSALVRGRRWCPGVRAARSTDGLCGYEHTFDPASEWLHESRGEGRSGRSGDEGA